MVFDANGNDIGQALALKVSLSEVRIKDARARAAKEKREKKERKGLDSTVSWISASLSNLTSDFSLDGTGSLASSTSTRGRIVKETLIGNLTDPTMPRCPPRKTNSYIPSKYVTHQAPAPVSSGGLFGLFKSYACDGREDVDDTDSTYTAHRDERGVVIYEV
jgi:hypothetical protein